MKKATREEWLLFCDLGRIQTCNLLSRNQMRYSVAPRGLLYIKISNQELPYFAGANINLFYISASIK
ncbi:hypothetical protein MED217_04427 [Leeuwenhoekiella blandensis MED217]|uniref:Uncharacterized protein n=1 Tax=Leeuwenhoekiella blandensis (strain CECT 7118 / CCUG 51940 / KCTC 22103 / MED217) TaxID=398720 RepID=A3XJM3_LEEBM|nr:hypothetical protein MED217_04427 [Leeuwenhoekiella blandensis MED217]